ncbi:hypothetical protein LX81_02967 [Palleronia aestuarii]|uniref:Uncharacterized protein n=1 Tax=Palleronia aestuarii TaxID=568105 RepID=A0A2W7N1Z7_9RHOB|nr:hypothetical protein [Palleronia aestuarii]PZX14168.1 hypothetical protein LX81_02967 [Palleronia aestuarii]
MNALSPITSAWKSAQLLIAFHRNKDGRTRSDPRLWSPKNGVAGVTDDPKAKESFLVVRGHGDAGDVQIKLHPDKIIVRRDPDAIGWSGIQVDHYGVRVLVGDVWITVQHDGSIKREVEGRDNDTSWLEADGEFLRLTPDMEINVSGDGAKMTRRTNEGFAAIVGDVPLSTERAEPERPLAYENRPRLARD